MKKFKNKKYDDAVSPVIGVMLMLVVTIIIAAVVSAFAGSLASANAEKTPSLSMDIRIINTGHYSESGFFATVTGVSEAIPTKDLQLVTRWRDSNGTPQGDKVSGGAANVKFTSDTGLIENAVSPFGTGAGVAYAVESGEQYFGDATAPYGKSTDSTSDNIQNFGNYALIPGTTLAAKPAPYTSAVPPSDGYGITERYKYDAGFTEKDAVQAILGKGWENLKTGDSVLVSIIHTPSGKTILSKTIPVEAIA